MVTPTLKETVDQLSEAERRDLLHYLEQTVEDDLTLTDVQVAELERRDEELASGTAEPLSIDQLLKRTRQRIR